MLDCLVGSLDIIGLDLPLGLVIFPGGESSSFLPGRYEPGSTAITGVHSEEKAESLNIQYIDKQSF